MITRYFILNIAIWTLIGLGVGILSAGLIFLFAAMPYLVQHTMTIAMLKEALPISVPWILGITLIGALYGLVISC